jgi:hypothetical protein
LTSLAVANLAPVNDPDGRHTSEGARYESLISIIHVSQAEIFL